MTEHVVVEVVGRFVKHAGAAVTRDARLATDLGLDSVDVLEVTVTIEDTLGVSIADDDLKGVTTVGDLIAVAEAAGPR